MKGIRNGRAGGILGMKAEDVKGWLEDMVEEEEEGTEGKGDTWKIFDKLIQVIWETGEMPQQMMWVMVVLVPKGGGQLPRHWPP